MQNILIPILFISSLFAKDIIAVLDLDQIGLTPQEATILTQRLISRLISINRYQVVERNNMDKILKEQKFQHSGCSESECAVEIGQLLNSDYIIIGSVNKFGKTYAIDVRLIDVGLGKSLISAEFSMTGEIDELLTTGMASIAKQLCDLPAQKTAEATQVDIPINVDLIHQQGYLHSSFEPQEAIIIIDGDTVTNNSTSLLNTGNYKLTAKLTNYYLVNKSVTISKDDTIYVNHTLQYGLDDYKKLLKQNKKHGKLFIIPAAMSTATYAVKTYYNSKYENATSKLVKSHYLGIHDIFDTAFTVSSFITMGTGLYITYNKQRAKTLKFQLSL